MPWVELWNEPYWGYWQALAPTEQKLWVCIALSLRINPQTITEEVDSNGVLHSLKFPPFMDGVMRDVFMIRLGILVEHRSAGSYFSPLSKPVCSTTSKAAQLVRLSEFASWAMYYFVEFAPHEFTTVHVPFPEELKQIAEAPEKPLLSSSAAAEPTEHENQDDAAPPVHELGHMARKKINRRDALDRAIDSAIELAGNVDVAAVWSELRELALGSVKPFTGTIDGAKLCYTTASNKKRWFPKDALAKRLRRRAPPSAV